MNIFPTSRLFAQISALAVIFAFLALAGQGHAAVADEIADKNRQIEELQRQIDAYEKEIEANRSKAGTLQGEINRLNGQINQVTLEVRSLSYSIDKTSLEITDTQSKIMDAESRLVVHQGALTQYIRKTDEIDRTSLTEILLSNASLSDFFTNVNSLQSTQDNIRVTIGDIKGLKA
ncbi:MAG: hypothetical protein Q8P35_02295, partial [Candidatus Yanofskybacteria bacterium]|nr:hypothetical protein [Candidatus Yanofskybacteria bacterium]